MAQGAYVAAGGIKTVSGCYVGAGGVKTVSAIYVGQGGSVRLVWPMDIYNNGTFGSLCGGGGTCLAGNSSNVSAEFSTNTIHFSDTAYEVTTCAGVIFDSTLATGNYNSLSADFVINTVPTSENYDVNLAVGLYSTKPTIASYFTNSSYRAYYNSFLLNNKSTGTTYTCTLDMSSISGSYYVGVYVYNPFAGTNRRYDLDISRVYVS